MYKHNLFSEDTKVPRVKEFKYLGSTVQESGGCEREVKKTVQAGWNGWRRVSGVICDKRLPARVKGKVYSSVLRPAMVYGLETVAVTKKQFCPTPTYLGVKLDRSLTFRHHLVALRKKLSSRVTLLRRLVGSGWGAGAKTLRIATLSLVYSAAEYCAPVWCCSAHTRLIDSVLNDALRMVTGCLRPTPTDHLPVLSGIQPAELRRMGATLSLAYRGSVDPDHILYGLLSRSSDTGQVRLRSRRLFMPAARNLLDNLARLGIRASEWTNHKWNAEYCESASRLRASVPETGVKPVGWAYPEQLGLSLTACELVLGDSICPCTNGVSLLHRIASVAPLSKPQTMY